MLERFFVVKKLGYDFFCVTYVKRKYEGGVIRYKKETWGFIYGREYKREPWRKYSEGKYSGEHMGGEK